MQSLRHAFAAVLVLPLIVAGCRVETINYFPPKPAHVRFANFMVDAHALDVREGETLAWSGVAFENGTAYSDFNNERKTFSVSLAGETSTLVAHTDSLSGEQPYTLVAYGTVNAPLTALLPDQTVFLNNGTFQFRILNAAVGAGTVDLYLTPPGVSFDTAVPTISGVAYAAASRFLSAVAGDYLLRVTESGTRNVLYETPARSFAENVGFNIVVFSRGGGRLVNVALLDSVGGGNSAIPESTLARYKVINGASTPGAVDQLLDGTRVVSELAYPAASAYNTATAGERTFTFEASSVPGATIASLVRTLSPSSDSSVFLTGSAGPVKAIAIDDTNLPPVEGSSRVRFVNASLEAQALDVYVNGEKRASALAATSASGYVELSGGTYAITFNDAVSGNALLTLSAVELAAGRVTTIYAVGPPAQLQGLVTQDR